MIAESPVLEWGEWRWMAANCESWVCLEWMEMLCHMCGLPYDSESRYVLRLLDEEDCGGGVLIRFDRNDDRDMIAEMWLPDAPQDRVSTDMFSTLEGALEDAGVDDEGDVVYRVVIEEVA